MRGENEKMDAVFGTILAISIGISCLLLVAVSLWWIISILLGGG